MDKSKFQLVDQLAGDDDEDTRLLRDMAHEARAYIQSFKWCPPIRRELFACGVGGVIALFLFEFTDKIAGTDDELWVVTGDIPSAYMVVPGNDIPSVALESYCMLMEQWVHTVMTGNKLADVFPVRAEKSVANAEALRSRIDFLRNEVIPNFE